MYTAETRSQSAPIQLTSDLKDQIGRRIPNPRTTIEGKLEEIGASNLCERERESFFVVGTNLWFKRELGEFYIGA